MKNSAKKQSILFLLATLFGCAEEIEPTKPNPQLKTIEVTAGKGRALVEVALSEEEKKTGLMFRESLNNNNGMLFVYDDEFEMCVWMKNTSFPLSIAFMDAEGMIVDIHDMAPNAKTDVCSITPVQYVLEMPKGWFAANDVAAHVKVNLTGLKFHL